MSARGLKIDHPAVFPVALVSEMLGAFSDARDLAFEPFCGSGTQLIAAEKDGRRCFAVEIAPAYCDVAVKRWSKFICRPVLLADDGRTFDEVAQERGTFGLANAQVPHGCLGTGERCAVVSNGDRCRAHGFAPPALWPAYH